MANLKHKILLVFMLFLIAVPMTFAEDFLTMLENPFDLKLIGEKIDIRDNIKVNFQHIYSGITQQEFIMTIENYDLKEKQLNISNFLLEELKVVEGYNMQIFEIIKTTVNINKTKSCNITEKIEQCTDDELNKTKTCKLVDFIINKEDIVCGSYIETDIFNEEILVNNGFNKYEDYRTISSVNLQRIKALQKRTFKIVFTSKASEIGKSWGNVGLLVLQLNDDEFWDKTHSSWWNSTWATRYNLSINAGKGAILRLNITSTECGNNRNETRVVFNGYEYPFEWGQGNDNTTTDTIEFIYNITGQSSGNYSLYCDGTNLVPGSWGNKTVFISKDNANNGVIDASQWKALADGAGSYSERTGYIYGIGDGTDHSSFLNGTRLLTRGIAGLYVSFTVNGSFGIDNEYFGLAKSSYLGASGQMRKLYITTWPADGSRTLNADNYTYPTGPVGDYWGGAGAAYKITNCQQATFGFYLNGSNTGSRGATVYVNDTCGIAATANGTGLSPPSATGASISNEDNFFLQLAAKSTAGVTGLNVVYASNYPFNISLPIDDNSYTITILDAETETPLTSTEVVIDSPINTVYGVSSISLNFSGGMINTDSCWYEKRNISYGVNISLTGCANTTLNLPDGNWNLTVYINDTSNRINSSKVSFGIDTTPPILITWSPQNSNRAVKQGYFYNNISMLFQIKEQYLDSCWWQNYSGLNNISVPCTNASIIWPDGLLNITTFANDTFGRTNRSIIIIFRVDTVPLNITAKYAHNLSIVNNFTAKVSFIGTTTATFNTANGSILLYPYFYEWNVSVNGGDSWLTYNQTYMDYDFTLNTNLTAFLYSSAVNIVAKTKLTNTTITTFNSSLMANSKNTSNGSITFLAGNLTMQFIGSAGGYYNTTTTVSTPEITSYETTLYFYNSILNVSAYDIFSGGIIDNFNAVINSSGSIYSGTTTNGSILFYLESSNYSGYYDGTSVYNTSFNVNVENTTQIFNSGIKGINSIFSMNNKTFNTSEVELSNLTLVFFNMNTSSIETTASTENGSIIVGLDWDYFYRVNISSNVGDYEIKTITINSTVNYNQTEKITFFHRNSIIVNYYDEVLRTPLNTITIYTDLITDGGTYLYTTTSGILEANNLIEGFYTIRSRSSGYSERFTQTYLANLTAQNLSIYLVTLENATSLTVTVVNENEENVPAILVHLYRYDIASNSYTQREAVYTDDSGQAVFSIVLGNEYYKFIVELNGVIYLETAPSYIYTTSKTLQILTKQLTGQSFFEANGIYVNLSYNDVNKYFRLHWIDNGKVASQTCLVVTRQNSDGGETQLNESCGTSSGILYAGFTAVNGTVYKALAYTTLKSTSQKVPLAVYVKSFVIDYMMGDMGWIIILIILLIVVFATGYIDVSLPLILTPLVFIFGSAMHLINIQMAYLIPVAVLFMGIGGYLGYRRLA